MQSEEATKTYLALCHGDGTWKGENLINKGWFTVETPVKDENGNVKDDARTEVCFVAGKILTDDNDIGDDDCNDENNMDGRKVAIVLAKPKTGKWHQIRQHLSSSSLGHAILGDSVHGYSRTNRIWKKKRNMEKQRTCLHLARVKIPRSEFLA